MLITLHVFLCLSGLSGLSVSIWSIWSIWSICLSFCISTLSYDLLCLCTMRLQPIDKTASPSPFQNEVSRFRGDGPLSLSTRSGMTWEAEVTTEIQHRRPLFTLDWLSARLFTAEKMKCLRHSSTRSVICKERGGLLHKMRRAFWLFNSNADGLCALCDAH